MVDMGRIYRNEDPSREASVGKAHTFGSLA